MKEGYIMMIVASKRANTIMLILILMLTGCSVNNDYDEMDDTSVDVVDSISENLIDDQTELNDDTSVDIVDSISENLIDDQAEINEDLKNYEGVWQRTGVARYQAAEIRISNWEEETFDVVLYTIYSNTSGGSLRGTATFLDDDIAVLYDEEVETLIRDFNFRQDQVEDSGIYFQFTGNTIIVTHDPYIRNVFGGGGFATAEGTYIQGEPEYTTCTDIAEIFSESELESLQSLLGDRYVTFLRHIIEIGEIEEISIENGRLWKVYWMPYHQVWCNIIIYDNGDIYVEGYSDNGTGREYYTNTEDAEMPDIDNK